MTAEVIQYKDHTAQLERDRQIFRMRLEGCSVRAVADELEITIGEVHAAMHRMGTGVTPEYKARIVELDLERLEALHKVYFKLAIEEKDKEAATICLRVMDRRSKFIGADVLPQGATPQDDTREATEFDQVYEVIMRLARGPVVEGEVVKEEPPDGKA